MTADGFTVMNITERTSSIKIRHSSLTYDAIGDNLNMNQAELLKKFYEISGNISKNDWKYFHRSSLFNFINNIEQIKEENQREEINKILMNWMNDVETQFEPDVDYSLYLYNLFLKNVIPTFRKQLGFSVIPNINVIIVLTFGVVIIFILLQGYLLWEIIFCVSIALFIYKNVVKIRQHKAYGFRY